MKSLRLRAASFLSAVLMVATTALAPLVTVIAPVASVVAPAAVVATAAALAPAPVQAQALSDYIENALINHVFRATAYTAPGTVYIGLSTAACSDSGFGTEVSGGSYARASYATGTTQWAATNGTNGLTSNSNAITFATPSAGWGTVTHFFIADASTSGNLLICQALTTGKTINSGDTVSFPSSAITVTLQ